MFKPAKRLTPVKKPLALIVLVSVLLVAGELFARFYLGLGTPALAVKHPRIEYLFAPNQDVSRFGNRIAINEFSMRSDPLPEFQLIPEAKSDLRIMIFGDSVLFGGNQVDQTMLATSLLQTELRESDPGSYVGNISANSWGPGNWLAYANEYGFFEADIVVLILSGHDQSDNPTFGEFNDSTLPTRAPRSALVEALVRYSRGFVKSIRRNTDKAFTQHTAKSSGERGVKTDEEGVKTDILQVAQAKQASEQALSMLEKFLTQARQSSAQVGVIYHPDRREFETGEPHSGFKTISDVVQRLDIAFTSLEPYYRELSDAAELLYLDSIHPTVLGQSAIANALIDQISQTLQE